MKKEVQKKINNEHWPKKKERYVIILLTKFEKLNNQTKNVVQLAIIPFPRTEPTWVNSKTVFFFHNQEVKSNRSWDDLVSFLYRIASRHWAMLFTYSGRYWTATVSQKRQFLLRTARWVQSYFRSVTTENWNEGIQIQNGGKRADSFQEVHGMRTWFK